MEKNQQNSLESNFIKNLKFVYSQDSYTDLINNMWEEYVTSDTYCEKSKEDRVNDLGHIKQLKDILQQLGTMIK